MSSRFQIFMVALVVATPLVVATCLNDDGPGCGCFVDDGGWSGTGTWIQDIAMPTMGTIASCVPAGGKPYYQMRIGCTNEACAEIYSQVLNGLSLIGSNPIEREAWCSETISFWHRQAGIPYPGGYRGSSWLYDWQLPNVNAIRTFYTTEEVIDSLTPINGRGRWIHWSELDYSDFNPGINAPAPGSYVAIKGLDPTTGWKNKNSHSLMINEMTIHKNALGKVVQVSVKLIEGNAGNDHVVQSTRSWDDLLAYTPAGPKWLSLNRKIYGFGIDLDAQGEPIFDPNRVHIEQDPQLEPVKLNKVVIDDPVWKQHYGPLVFEIANYLKTTRGKLAVDGPSSVVGTGGLPDGKGVSWVFPQRSERSSDRDTRVTIDLLDDHPLPIRGILLVWQKTTPDQVTVSVAASDGRYRAIPPPQQQAQMRLSSSVHPVPYILAGDRPLRIRSLRLDVSKPTRGIEARLSEIRFLYAWGPDTDAVTNP